MRIIGISAYYHDSAACLIENSNVVAAAQEERFTRIKHDASFPLNAIKFCLKESQCTLTDIDYITFYEKPILKFDRLLETYIHYCPKGLRQYLKAMPSWVSEKLFVKKGIFKELQKISPELSRKNSPQILFNTHHGSHAASAYYASPFNSATVLCLDGVGEWATTSLWQGKGNQLHQTWEIDFPHSLGLLYSAFTYYTGFKVNSGEYKLMGLAPYGEPKYATLIKKHLIDIKQDGSFRLNMEYFSYTTALKMINSKFCNLFQKPARKSETAIEQFHMDIAASIQVVTEEIVLKLCNSAYKEDCSPNLCLAGGVALNCVANGKLLDATPFENIWVQPAAGDAGASLGAALATWYDYLGNPREDVVTDAMHGSYLGDSFSNSSIAKYLETLPIQYHFYSDEELFPKLATLLAEDNIIGWFSGKMEFGPRALGARSIIANPKSEAMQEKLNLSIKFRESFRPFAPAVKAEAKSEWFNIKADSPYMLFCANVHQDKLKKVKDNASFGLEKLKQIRSEIPAVTHVNNSARIQTVHKDTNPRFYKLIENFEEITHCPILINTSFNIRGEPIVHSPEDALKCFAHTKMDYLVLENYVLSRKDIQELPRDKNWINNFSLD